MTLTTNVETGDRDRLLTMARGTTKRHFTTSHIKEEQVSKTGFVLTHDAESYQTTPTTTGALIEDLETFDFAKKTTGFDFVSDTLSSVDPSIVVSTSDYKPEVSKTSDYLKESSTGVNNVGPELTTEDNLVADFDSTETAGAYNTSETLDYSSLAINTSATPLSPDIVSSLSVHSNKRSISPPPTAYASYSKLTLNTRNSWKNVTPSTTIPSPKTAHLRIDSGPNNTGSVLAIHDTTTLSAYS